MFGFGESESANRAEIAEQEQRHAEYPEKVREALDKISPFASESSRDPESIRKMIDHDEKYKQDLGALNELVG